MKYQIRFIFVCLLLILVGILPAWSQDLGKTVSVYSSENGSMYLQPLADAFGANINSGFFHSARIGKLGFHLQFGIAAMYAPIPQAKKNFSPVTEYGWNPDPGTLLSTIFGNEESVNIEGLEFPGGLWDTNFFPLAVPQLTIGSVLGTDVTVRYIKYKIDDEIGEIKLSGWGVRHSISQYIPLMPVDIALGLYYQNFHIGSIIDASATFVGLQASYSISIITLYGGAGLERSSLNITYDHDEGGQTSSIEFDLKGENHTRLTMGVAFDLFILKLHADYNLAAQNVLSAGVMLGI